MPTDWDSVSGWSSIPLHRPVTPRQFYDSVLVVASYNDTPLEFTKDAIDESYIGFRIVGDQNDAIVNIGDFKNQYGESVESWDDLAYSADINFFDEAQHMNDMTVTSVSY